MALSSKPGRVFAITLAMAAFGCSSAKPPAEVDGYADDAASSTDASPRTDSSRPLATNDAAPTGSSTAAKPSGLDPFEGTTPDAAYARGEHFDGPKIDPSIPSEPFRAFSGTPHGIGYSASEAQSLGKLLKDTPRTSADRFKIVDRLAGALHRAHRRCAGGAERSGPEAAVRSDREARERRRRPHLRPDEARLSQAM